MDNIILNQKYKDTQKDSPPAGIYKRCGETKDYSGEHTVSDVKKLKPISIGWLYLTSAHYRICSFLISPIDLPSTTYGKIELNNTNNLDWDDPCQEVFEQLAENNPSELIAWIKSGSLQPPDLTFAAEILGRVRSMEGISPILLELLSHQSPLVREGALYGLYHYRDDPKVEDAIRQIEAKDPSLTIRETAAEILDD